MPRRSILTARQRAARLDLPTDEASIFYHYTLSDEDLEHINVRRRFKNRFGYALKLCALRHPSRLLSSREGIPESVVRFIGAQLGMTGDEILSYAARHGEAMNLINAKYGSEPGFKAYTHISDQFGPFATQNIPATVSEAPYILNGMLMNEAGRKITEQYADTGGFTDHVFAVTSLLGFRFIPRIRDRTAEGQHYRMAGLNLLAAIIIYWNTKHLGQAVARTTAGRVELRPRSARTYLPTRMGPHPAHRRIPVAAASWDKVVK